MKTLLITLNILVALLTPEKAQEIDGTEYLPNCYFNVVEDCAGNNIISLVEAQYLQLGDFTVIEWCPPVVEEDEE